MDFVILGLPMMYYIAMVAKVLVAFVFVLLTVAYATYAERKIIGHMQVRLGPMRTGLNSSSRKRSYRHRPVHSPFLLRR